MNRLGLLGLVASALVACSHPQPPVTPLPPEKPAEPVAKAEPAPPPAPPAPPKVAPFDIELGAPGTATVKLVSPGKGKRVVATVAPAAGGKTPVELHVDFTPTQDGTAQRTPTLILRGDAEVTAADKTGAQYKITITATDTHYPEKLARIDQLERGLAGVVGMTMTGNVTPDGEVGKLALHHDAAAPMSSEVMKLFNVTWLPAWPVLPKEAIAPGAKWQATTMYKLASQLDITEVTDYELVSYKDKTWTIKGTSKVTGGDQAAGEGVTLKDISGTGTLQATLVDGALIPTVHHTLTVAFTAAAPQGQLKLALELGNDIGAPGTTPTPTPTPTPAPTPTPTPTPTRR